MSNNNLSADTLLEVAEALTDCRNLRAIDLSNNSQSFPCIFDKVQTLEVQMEYELDEN